MLNGTPSEEDYDRVGMFLGADGVGVLKAFGGLDSRAGQEALPPPTCNAEIPFGPAAIPLAPGALPACRPRGQTATESRPFASVPRFLHRIQPGVLMPVTRRSPASVLATTGLLVLLILLFAPRPASAQSAEPATGASPAPPRYVVDPAHTTVEFAVRHLGLSKVRGSFSGVSGTVFYDSMRPERSSATVLIETASIDTDNERRDEDLRANFFHVEAFPRITFQSTRVEREGDGYRMHGQLGIRDSLHAVSFPVAFLGRYVDDGSGERRVGFEGGLTIDRTDYGVTAPEHPAELRLVIGHEIEIDLQVEAQIPGYGGTTFRTANGRSIGEELEAVLSVSGADAARVRHAEVAATPEGFDMSARELALLGFRQLQAGEMAGSVLAFELYAEAEPSATADEWLGNAYLQAGRSAEAEAAYERALGSDPWRPSAIEGLRQLRGTTGKASLSTPAASSAAGG